MSNTIKKFQGHFALLYRYISTRIATKLDISWPWLCSYCFPSKFLAHIHQKSWVKACQGPQFGTNWHHFVLCHFLASKMRQKRIKRSKIAISLNFKDMNVKSIFSIWILILIKLALCTWIFSPKLEKLLLGGYFWKS